MHRGAGELSSLGTRTHLALCTGLHLHPGTYLFCKRSQAVEQRVLQHFLKPTVQDQHRSVRSRFENANILQGGTALGLSRWGKKPLVHQAAAAF